MTHHQESKKTSRRHWRLIFITIALSLLSSFIGITRLVQRAEQNIVKMKQDIELAVEADVLLERVNQDRKIKEEIEVPSVTSSAGKLHQANLNAVSSGPVALSAQFQEIELFNDIAMVRVMVEDAIMDSRRVNDGDISGQKPLLYETWFYRQTEEGWVRVVAHKTQWGPVRSRETPHVQFQYHQLDHKIVSQVAPAIEIFAVELYHDVGLKLPPEHKKLTIRVVMNADPQFFNTFYLLGASDGILILSPRLLRVPSNLTDADVLQKSIHAVLAYHIIDIALQEYQPQDAWQPLADGLRLWAYLAQSDFDSEQSHEFNTLLHQQLAVETPLRLPDLSVSPPPLPHPEDTQAIRWKKHILAKTVVDYAVSAYGHASLARLLAGLHRYDSWHSLIPAVFGVSAEDFELDWQIYLANQYGQRG